MSCRLSCCVLRIIIYNILMSCSCPASCPAAPCVLLLKLFWCRAGVLPAVLRCPAYRYLQYSGVLQLSCWLSCSVLLCTAYHYLQCSGVLLIVQQCPAVSCAPLFTVFWCSRLGVLRSCEENCLCKTVALTFLAALKLGVGGGHIQFRTKIQTDCVFADAGSFFRSCCGDPFRDTFHRWCVPAHPTKG